MTLKQIASLGRELAKFLVLFGVQQLCLAPRLVSQVT